MEQNSPSNPLQYAPPVSKAGRWRWRIVFGVLAVTIGLLAWTRGPAVWDRAKVLYWQRQCLNYTAPADQLVYDNTSADPPSFLAAGCKDLAAPNPRALHRPVGRTPACWTAYLDARGKRLIASPNSAVLFLGELASAGGTRRLICVGVDQAHSPEIQLERAVWWESYEPVGWRERGTQDQYYFQKQGLGGLSGSLQIYAGQRDGQDPSQFTIRFTRTEEGVIVGRLNDSGYLDLEFRGAKGDGFDTPLEQE